MLNTIASVSSFVESNLRWASITSEELTTFTLLMFFAILTALESYCPREKKPFRQVRQSYRTNISLFLFNSIVLSLASASSLFALAGHYSETGLLDAIANPIAKAAISLLLLDLLFYLWHKASHCFNWLWIFHKVHHNEPHLNVTTAFRIHVLELAIATLLKAAYIIVLGIDKTIVLTYESLMILFVMFHHANISFPGEKLLGKLIIVPYLHRVHHSTIRIEHDSNYGAILSIWDRLFGTFKELEPAQIGIKGDTPQTFFELVKFGFRSKYGWTPPPVTTSSPAGIQSMVAEAAYYKAEKRSFKPGYELTDWLEAEREIVRRFYNNRPAGNRTKEASIQLFKPGCAKTKGSICN